MERLTERTADGILVKENYEKESLKTLYPCYGEKPNSYYSNCEEGYCAMEKLADYEDLEEQGRLIKLPCKVGDKVWHISGRDIKEDVISGIEYSYDGMFYIWSNEDTWLGGFNDIVFLTKSEAEQKLKKMESGEDNEE